VRPAHAGKKRDANESAIVDALKEAGATVERLDIVDLLVGFRGGNWLMEVKTVKGLKRKSRTADRQQRWRAGWQGNVYVVSEPAEALGLIGIAATRK
jgi:hypothetical protein